MRALAYLETTDTAAAPAGTTSATATPILLSTADVYAPVVGSGTGFRLPAGNKGDVCTVGNGSGANALKVYPNTGAAINGLAADAAITIPINSAGIFYCHGPLIWVCVRDTATTDTDTTLLGPVFVSSKGADAAVAYFVAPHAGTIALIQTVLAAALATGNATVTVAINGTPVTTGVVTATQAASAAGSRFAATPTALNIVAAGDLITATVGGASTATATLGVQLYLAKTF